MSSRLSLPVWFFALIVLLPFAARSEGLYIAAHWPGEYPAGLFVKKDVSLPAYRSPDLKNKSNQTCTLPKGMVLHPWSQKRPQVKFASSWVPQKFLAMTDDSELGVLAGEQITQLSATAEGFCEVSIKGVIQHVTCPAYNDAVYQALGQSLEESLQQLWVLAPCTSGRSAWIEVMTSSHAGLMVDSEMISEFGQIREDSLISKEEAAEMAMTEILNHYSLTDTFLLQKPDYHVRDQKDVFPQGTQVTISRQDRQGAELSRDVVLVSYDGKILK